MAPMSAWPGAVLPLPPTPRQVAAVRGTVALAPAQRQLAEVRRTVAVLPARLLRAAAVPVLGVAPRKLRMLAAVTGASLQSTHWRSRTMTLSYRNS